MNRIETISGIKQKQDVYGDLLALKYKVFQLRRKVEEAGISLKKVPIRQLSSTDELILDRFLSAEYAYESKASRHFKPLIHNCFYQGYVSQILREGHDRWSVRDIDASGRFRNMDPRFDDLNGGRLDNYIDPGEDVALITNPLLMASSYVDVY